MKGKVGVGGVRRVKGVRLESREQGWSREEKGEGWSWTKKEEMEKREL